VVPAAVAVIAVGLASVLTQDGAVAATETWTPIAAESAAPPVATRFGAPNDVHRAADGSLLVADFSANGLLRRAADGTWTVVAPFGTAPGDLWNPSAVTTTADGRILVAEAGRLALAVLDPDGHVVSRTAPPVRRGISELAVTGTTVFAAVPGSGSLFTSELGTDAWTTVPGPWTDPSGVAVSDDGGTLTVSDAGTDEVWQVDRATGTVTALGFPGDAQSRPRGLAVDDGDVFVVDNGHGVVWARTAGEWAAAFSSAPDGSSLANPTAVTVGPDRTLVVADYNRQRIVTASSSGRVVAVPSPSASAAAPTPDPAVTPTADPTVTPQPAADPTVTPEPTADPTATPTPTPTADPTLPPSPAPSAPATTGPTTSPTSEPSLTPAPTSGPTAAPSPTPTADPTPPADPTPVPTVAPTSTPVPTSSTAPTTAPGPDPTPSATAGGPGTGTVPPGRPERDPAAPDASDEDGTGTGTGTGPGTGPGSGAGAEPAPAGPTSGTLAWTGTSPLLPTLLAGVVLVARGLLLRRRRS